MPKVHQDGNYVAWLDNNGHFNNDESRAMVFSTEDSLLEKLHDPDVDYIRMLETTGCSYLIERYNGSEWETDNRYLEKHLSRLCEL